MMERYLQIKHNNEPSKGELAAMLHVSERQLERIFDDVYGMSFREKVQKIRFETARYLRENLHYSAQRIAEIVGYSSVQAYYKAYKAYFNQHPED